MERTAFERITQNWPRNADGQVVFYKLLSSDAVRLDDDTVILHLTWARDEAHAAAIAVGTAHPEHIQFLAPAGLAKSTGTKLGVSTGAAPHALQSVQ